VNDSELASRLGLTLGCCIRIDAGRRLGVCGFAPSHEQCHARTAIGQQFRFANSAIIAQHCSQLGNNHSYHTAEHCSSTNRCGQQPDSGHAVSASG
jgi:hypothetical protein